MYHDNLYFDSSPINDMKILHWRGIKSKAGLCRSDVYRLMVNEDFPSYWLICYILRICFQGCLNLDRISHINACYLREYQD